MDLTGSCRGRWALITGASAGIGAAFARSFAARGSNLVLVARREGRLLELAAELKRSLSVETLVLPCDLGRPDAPETVGRFTEEKGLCVDFLVNNAGFGLHGVFDERDLSRQLQMIDLNCRSLVALSHLYGGRMRASGRGAIINVASIASFMSAPGLAVYAATKAFVLSFSEAIADELAPHGVRVLALCPGGTSTEFQEVAGYKGPQPQLILETAEQVAEGALRALERGKITWVSGWHNRLLIHGLRLLPRRLISFIAGRFLRRCY